MIGSILVFHYKIKTYFRGIKLSLEIILRNIYNFTLTTH